MDRTNARPASASSPRPLLRRPGILLFTALVAGSAVGLKYMASKMRENELAQKNSSSPNLYVTVDRSGGGI
ncbi:hypothetical protein VTK73DRAFT_3511 [Phialemonium thermophilum]|uniref:Uncharacterized protein n=1 Tax=Phialemonium thermophilum TaxID=223376 RepID=A0ABR3WZJ9_9PEZI